MSEENVALFKKAIESYNRRDIEAMLKVWHPEAVWYPFTAQVEGDDAYHGREGLRQWWANVDATFEEIEASVEDVRDLDDTVRRKSAGSPVTATVLPCGDVHTKAMPRPSKLPGCRNSAEQPFPLGDSAPELGRA